MPSPDTPQSPLPQGDPCAPEEYAKARREVAEWMGWTRIYPNDEARTGKTAFLGWAPGAWESNLYSEPIPDPLGSPADFAALLEEIVSRGYTVKAGDTPEGNRMVVIQPVQNGRVIDEGKTLREALFRAAFAAMRAEKEAKANG